MPIVTTSHRQPTSPRRRLASLAEGADYCGISTKTLRRWGAAGQVTLYRAGPRLLRVDLNELDALLRPIPTTDPAA